MLKGEVFETTTKRKETISFFDDDTIDSIRSKIGAVLDIHPDRLYILVGLNLDAAYYTSDPRRWEALFERMSYNNEPLKQDVFTEYQTEYRTPPTHVAFSPYDKTEWMTKPEALKPLFETDDFLEYHIFGVEEPKSFVLPIENISNTLVGKIPAVKYPIPENSKLFNSFYSAKQFRHFRVRAYTPEAESNIAIYYPLLQSKTPAKLPDEVVDLLQKNTDLLKSLLQLDVPSQKQLSIIRTKFYIPWVDTDFGAAIRTRLEQIFYGITVSEDVPCITLFTSKDQVSRHKFFTKDKKHKTPFLDMEMWKSWWSVKPARNIPSIVLFRGKTRHDVDRITITAQDMVVVSLRKEGSKETIDDIQKNIVEWFKKFDAIIPFVEKDDLQLSRWELQDISCFMKYENKLDEFDLNRFNCVTNLFDMPDKSVPQFSILRTDHSNNGLTIVDVKIIQMMKAGSVKPEMVAEELSITRQVAAQLIAQVQSKIDADSRIATRVFKGYPTLKLGSDYMLVSGISNIEKNIHYANILRYILSNPDSDKLDKICPRRAETVTPEAALVSSDAVELDASKEEAYSSLFDAFEEAPEDDTVSLPESVSTTTSKKVSTIQTQATNYGYFTSRLQKFDPVTFNPKKSQYAKKCEQSHQPIILNDEELEKIKRTPYMKTIEEYQIATEDPSGTIICPEYWCMVDQIPLQDSQLDKSEGQIRCPVCHGQLRTRASDKPREFPLIKRESGFIFPGYKDYKSPHNGKRMPCCFKRDRSKVMKGNEDKYYILQEAKTAPKERIAFLQENIRNNLHINEKYELFKGTTRRLTSPNKGYFRVGMGNPTETLPKFLGLKVKIPSPKESVETVLKCSFLSTWQTMGTTHLESISNEVGKQITDELAKEKLSKIISGIDDAFHKKELSVLEELEYSAISLQCDIFRVSIDNASVGCMFYTHMVRPRSRAIIVLQIEDDIDILSYVERKSQGFDYQANIYKAPFTSETYSTVEKLRNQACKTKIPSFDDAVNSVQKIMPTLEGVEEYEIVLDPYGRGQAIYIPNKLILPFQSIPLPQILVSKKQGYSDIPDDSLPEYEEMKKLLAIAAQISPGYAYKEDLYNSKHQKSELLLECGLRVLITPVDSDTPNEVEEVVATTKELGESNLVFGERSIELEREQHDVSYAAEVYEYMLFQLSKDIETGYKELSEALREMPPLLADVKPLLKTWFDKTAFFVEITSPKKFISKIRKPCGEDCDGDLCGWDDKTCKIKLDEKIDKDKLFARLLTTLINNPKIRAIVLDGRITPFFSTILYLELPHEVIVSDTDLHLDVIDI